LQDDVLLLDRLQEAKAILKDDPKLSLVESFLAELLLNVEVA
jgi:hypothetical protein